MKRFSLHGITLGAAAALLAGCTMIPHYHRPVAPVSQHGPPYGGDSQPTAQNTLSANLCWPEFSSDPRLNPHIANALR